MTLEFLPSGEGFLGIPAEEAVADPKAVIIPFSIEASVSYGGGTSKGAEAMIAASHEVELFDDEFWREPYRDYGVATLPTFEIQTPLKAAIDQLEQVTESVLAAGKFPLIFGGEHSLTAGSIKPFVKRYPDLAVLHFDAHADLRDGFEGEHYSHASAMRRVLDHEHIHLVSFGIRNISASEIPFLKANRHRIHMHFARDKKKWDIDAAMEKLRGRHVYVSFDLDGFDSSIMWATGTPEPGGVLWDETLAIIRRASEVSTFVGGDIVELAPIEGFHACDFLAAKLAYKILNYGLAKKG